MGDWSRQPWGNDEAADWFHKFWKIKDFTILISEIEDFDPTEEKYDSIRAASYLLQTLGIVYVWPSEHLEVLKPLLNKAITILTHMVNPPNDDWGFLDMWGNDPAVIYSVKEQITLLEMRINDLV
ncbi:hypothetical protein [Flavobacterium sp. '19STA2R22 D10 B1']|uniref:hypothetical protein n=1 Tax=Flavobacterium aerium TaxID=3037261 RepID=UPI00278C85AD|nr:hypothetical protein [Flavobacterium sp. '19STA2R22 D10 B1']